MITISRRAFLFGLRGLIALCVCLPTIASQSLDQAVPDATRPPPASHASSSRLTNLMFYQTPQDEIMPVLSPTDWPRRRSQILARAQEVMGPLPGADKRVDLQVEVMEEVDCGKYVRQKITYRSEPGNVVPAYLLVPKTAHQEGAKLTGVLCLHPTDNVEGNNVVVGLTDKPNRNYAEELAERGFVAIAPAYPLLADYQPDLNALGYESGTMKAIWDNIRALDLLDSLPFVDHRAYGAIGHSLGGHNAVFTAVFDQRLHAIVSSCGFDSFQDYKDGNIAGWISDKYMPKLLDYHLTEIPFDFDELIAALAPRRCFISAPLHDHNFNWRSVARIGQAAARVYELLDARDRLLIEHPDAGHDFPLPMREIAYSIFNDLNKEIP